MMREMFFFKDTATTEIYTLSRHDALPISATEENPEGGRPMSPNRPGRLATRPGPLGTLAAQAWTAVLATQLAFSLARIDRKSKRLNSSHDNISYAVFCL